MDACVVGQQELESGSAFWMWCAIFFVFCMVVGIGVTTYLALKKLRKDLTSCWNQVADEDSYIDSQQRRIDVLFQRVDNLDRMNEHCANQNSQLNDYVNGLHYAVVEQGGFVRNVMGLNSRQWEHLSVTERANLIAFNTMGLSTMGLSIYLQLVQQRASLQARYAGEDTDEPAGESDEPAGENDGPQTMETDQHDGEPTIAPMPRGRLLDLSEMMKEQQSRALNENRIQHALILQHSILDMLEITRSGGGTAVIYRKCLEVVEQTFLWLETVFRMRGNEELGDEYEALAVQYRA